MASNRIYIQVDFQSQDANAAITSLNQNISNIGTASQQATAQATAGVKGFSVSVDQASNSLSQLSAALTGLGVARVTQQLVVMGDQLNRIQRAFAATAGGAQAFQELQKIAEASRFSFENLAASANQLRNFGVAMKDLPGVMRAFSGAVDQAAGNTEDLSQAVQAFGQMTNQQFVSAKSVYQSFGAVGLQIMQMLRDETHKSVQQIREDTRLMNTDILAQMIIIQARIKSLEAGPVGESVTARFSQLLTSINALAQELDHALGPSLGKVLGLVESLVTGLTDLTKAFEKLPEPVRDVAVGLGGLALAGGAVAGAFAAWRGIAGVVGTVTAFLGGAAAATATVAAEAGTAATVLTGVISLGTGLGEIAAIIAAIVGGVALLMSFGEKAKTQAPTKDARDQQIADLKRQLADLSKRLYAPDEKKTEEANKRAADLLDEANKRSLMVGKESIAALTEAYKVHFRSVAGFAEATATVRKALEVDIATEVKKADEERRKEHLKNLDELLSLQRKVDNARASVIPDETYAGRQQSAQRTASDFEADIRQQTASLNAEYDRRAKLQIDSLRAMGGEHAAEVANLEKMMADNRIEQNAIADAKVAQHRLQSEREINVLIEEQRKQMAEQDLQDQLTLIEQTKNLRVAALGATTPESLPERLKQMRDVQQAQIEAIQKTRDARISAAKGEYDYFVQEHPGATESIGEEYAKFEHLRIQTSRDAEVQIQLERINLWKESNDAIIAEQKKVYEGIKSALDKVWDALLSRSQSVWQALGNALKTAVLGAMKEIVTSRLAATIAGVFGYGTYSFKRGIGGIYEPPSPSGSGIPLEVPAIGTGGGGIVTSPSGGGQGGAARYVTDELGQYMRAAQIETGSQADVARMQSRGYAGRSMDDQVGGTLPAATGGTTGGGGGTTVGGTGGGGFGGYGIPGAAGGRTSMQQSVARLRDTLNIGKPITVADGTFDAKGNAIPAGGTIPWADATGMQRMSAILKSPAAAQIGMTAGSMLAIAGLQRGGPAGGAEAITGSTLMGVSAASMFPALGLTYLGGALLGAGLGTLAYGIQRGGKVGAGLDVAGGALAGAVVGTAIFPGLGTAAGALIGAGVGAIAGAARLLFPTLMERIRSEVKRVYGVDIPQASIRKQIADIITQKYGGNLSIGIYSQDVQDIVRLYAISTAQSQGGLPRPEYAASFAQSQAGGLQIQPVYSGGQLINNPYVGATQTQLSNALFTNPAVYMQLHPQQAMALFSGQVVKVLGDNPGTVAAANTAAAQNGTNRTTQASALMEPLTVTR
jgi:hypothetical protein